MAVIGRKVGRLDIRLVRGDTQRVGGRWRKRNLVTGETTPVDLRAWAGQIEMRSPDGRELWFEHACETMTSDGYAICDIPSNAFTGEQWGTRRSGQWKIVVSHRAHRQTLAWGYWTLSE